MERAKLLRFGGYAAGVVLIVFGIATIAIGIAGKNTVEDELSQEKIVGSPDMSPEGIAPGIEEAKLTVDAPDCEVAEEPITPEPRLAASRSTCGSTRSSLQRAHLRRDGTVRLGLGSERPCRHERRDGRGEGREGRPVSNAARNLWVTETALATALNMSYMATGVAIFSIVVGIALILAGVGFLLLAAAVFRGKSPEATPA